MNQKLTVFLVEDDEEICISFRQLIDASADLTLLGYTGSASEAVYALSARMPDVIILDLELHLGSGSGADVLKELRAMALRTPPFVLVTTNNTSRLVYEAIRALGADYILCKKQKDYSEKYVLELLRTLSGSIKSRPHRERTAVLPVNGGSQKLMREAIMRELDLVGINRKYKGYNYLVDAIELMAEAPTQNICSKIAEKCGRSENSVERAIQNSINRAWETSSMDELLEHYTARISSYKGVPTLTEFICFYANKLRNAYT